MAASEQTTNVLTMPASPEILWNNSVVLCDEAAFVKRATAGELRFR